MQRRWRIGRLVLAGLFLALAMLAYAWWPATLRWRVTRHERSVLGFCSSRNVIWTVNGFYDQSFPASSDDFCALDIDTGNTVSGHRLLYGSVLVSDNILSSNGQYLAVHQTALKKINIIDTTSGDSMVQIDPAANYYDATFSHDGRWFVLANATTIEVWDLTRRCRQHAYDLKQLGQEDVEGKTAQQPHNPFMASGTSISASQDGRYLTFWREQVLAVFELGTMKLIGQAECQYYPQFMPDGTIGVFEAYSYRLNPWKTAFVIENSRVQRVIQTTETRKGMTTENDEEYVARNQTTYATVRSPSVRLRCPKWIPVSLQPSVNEWLAKFNKHWLLTLRELTTGKEILQVGLPSIDQPSSSPYVSFSVASGTFVSGYSLRRPIPFTTFISPDGCWLVKQDRDSIELWPLLTYWRPWYCWLTVVGLLLVAGYFAWFSRQSVFANQ